MINFDILGVQWKIQFLVGEREKVHKKIIYRGLPNKGARKIWRFDRRLGKNESGWFYWGSFDTLVQSMNDENNVQFRLSPQCFCGNSCTGAARALVLHLPQSRCVDNWENISFSWLWWLCVYILNIIKCLYYIYYIYYVY